MSNEPHATALMPHPHTSRTTYTRSVRSAIVTSHRVQRQTERLVTSSLLGSLETCRALTAPVLLGTCIEDHRWDRHVDQVGAASNPNLEGKEPSHKSASCTKIRFKIHPTWLDSRISLPSLLMPSHSLPSFPALPFPALAPCLLFPCPHTCLFFSQRRAPTHGLGELKVGRLR
jgi:hypothetical protein